MKYLKTISLKELSEKINVNINGDENFIVDNISEPESANERSIVYLSNQKNIGRLENIKANSN